MIFHNILNFYRSVYKKVSNDPFFIKIISFILFFLIISIGIFVWSYFNQTIESASDFIVNQMCQSFAHCMEANNPELGKVPLKLMDCNSLVNNPELTNLFVNKPGSGTVTAAQTANEWYVRFCFNKETADSVSVLSPYFQDAISSNIQEKCRCFKTIEEFALAMTSVKK